MSEFEPCCHQVVFLLSEPAEYECLDCGEVFSDLALTFEEWFGGALDHLGHETPTP